MTAYRARGAFLNPHINTIYAARLAPSPPVAYRRERWDAPDGDFIDVDFVDGPADAPFLLLFHGLAGSAQSSYARWLMAMVKTRGWRGAVAHFRGCSGEPNRRPRAYHSGDSPEADWILRRVRAHVGDAALHVVGVSLGGNVLAKWLGEQGEAAAFVRSAVSICAPLDLAACAEALEHGFSRVYAFSFLRSLRREALLRLQRFPGLYDPAQVRRAFTLRAFDDAVTAPLHGYADADDYYRRASAGPLLPDVRVPLLLINPIDDPFFPAAAWPTQFSPSVQVERPAHGGHVGFANLRAGRWLAERVLAFAELA